MLAGILCHVPVMPSLRRYSCELNPQTYSFLPLAEAVQCKFDIIRFWVQDWVVPRQN
jgi:hypothetical protein